MTLADDTRSRRLLELLLGRKAQMEQWKKLIDRASSFEELRVLLVCDSDPKDPLVVVLDHWRTKIAQRLVETDDRKVMHDLELLSLRQVELEKLLRANEASLLDKLSAIDSVAAELANVSSKVREVRTAIIECRRRVSEVVVDSRR